MKKKKKKEFKNGPHQKKKKRNLRKREKKKYSSLTICWDKSQQGFEWSNEVIFQFSFIFPSIFPLKKQMDLLCSWLLASDYHLITLV